MPELPEALFMEGLCAVAAACELIIPCESGQSLYLRPFVIGTQADLGIAVSNAFSFFVIASPSEVIHAGKMQVLIERETTRAALGGTGSVKVGGNYAAALLSAGRAREFGYHHSLWLDPRERRFVEELSAMNFFALIDGELHTPALSGSILPGITRDSIVQLARAGGVVVRERRIDIDELVGDIRAGRCTEAFACGTAAVITPISVLGEADGTEYSLAATEGSLTSQLRQHLFGIQEGSAADPFEWTQAVPDTYYRCRLATSS
jgi:branched-chain amino acid aminotransferase